MLMKGIIQNSKHTAPGACAGKKFPPLVISATVPNAISVPACRVRSVMQIDFFLSDFFNDFMNLFYRFYTSFSLKIILTKNEKEYKKNQ